MGAQVFPTFSVNAKDGGINACGQLYDVWQRNQEGPSVDVRVGRPSGVVAKGRWRAGGARVWTWLEYHCHRLLFKAQREFGRKARREWRERCGLCTHDFFPLVP